MRQKQWSALFLGLTIGLAVGLAVGLAGCSGGSGADKGDQKKTDGDNTPTGHAANAPHKGILFATRDDKYHLELVPREGVLYVLASNAKTPVPTDARSFTLSIKGDKPVKVEFTPDRQEKDPEGQASRFKGAADNLPRDREGYRKAEISGAIKGKPYHFELDEH
jgi:hypothetical protein